MRVRELLKKPAVGGSIAAVVVLAGAGAVCFSLTASSPAAPTLAPAVYYSDDDGKTFFAADSTLVPPFDHNGKTADMAAVFACGGGPRFVAYLTRYGSTAKAALEAIPLSDRRKLTDQVLSIRRSAALVKRPGDKQWVPLEGERPMADILRPACPDGKDERPEEVLP